MTRSEFEADFGLPAAVRVLLPLWVLLLICAGCGSVIENSVYLASAAPLWEFSRGEDAKAGLLGEILHATPDINGDGCEDLLALAWVEQDPEFSCQLSVHSGSTGEELSNVLIPRSGGAAVGIVGVYDTYTNESVAVLAVEVDTRYMNSTSSLMFSPEEGEFLVQVRSLPRLEVLDERRIRHDDSWMRDSYPPWPALEEVFSMFAKLQRESRVSMWRSIPGNGEFQDLDGDGLSETLIDRTLRLSRLGSEGEPFLLEAIVDLKYSVRCTTLQSPSGSILIVSEPLKGTGRMKAFRFHLERSDRGRN